MTALDQCLVELMVMPPAQLRSIWRDTFKTPAQDIGPNLSRRGIANRLQERVHGSLTEATVSFQERTGIPLFLGEFGAIDSATLKERPRYTYAVRKHTEALNIVWCKWSYTNTFHIRRDNGWIPEIAAALGLPLTAQDKKENEN